MNWGTIAITSVVTLLVAIGVLLIAYKVICRERLTVLKRELGTLDVESASTTFWMSMRAASFRHSGTITVIMTKPYCWYDDLVIVEAFWNDDQVDRRTRLFKLRITLYAPAARNNFLVAFNLASKIGDVQLIGRDDARNTPIVEPSSNYKWEDAHYTELETNSFGAVEPYIAHQSLPISGDVSISLEICRNHGYLQITNYSGIPLVFRKIFEKEVLEADLQLEVTDVVTILNETPQVALAKVEEILKNINLHKEDVYP